MSPKLPLDMMERVARPEVNKSPKYREIVAQAKRQLGVCPKHNADAEIVVEVDQLDRIYFSTKAAPDVVVVRQSGENWTRLSLIDAVQLQNASLNAARALGIITTDCLMAYGSCDECKAEIDATLAAQLTVTQRADKCAATFSVTDAPERGMIVFINTESTTLPKYSPLIQPKKS